MPKKSSKKPQKQPFTPQTGLGFAYRLGMEFFSGILVGLLLGYGIDHLWGTQPWGLVIMVIFGAAAGILNIFRLLGLWGAPPSSTGEKKNG